jgi:hypothetical protein
MGITSQMAFDIWKVLVDRAGAPDDMTHQETFIHYASGRDEVQEYRFMGYLGMGGKVRINAGRWTVDCYPEDLNDLRRTLIANTNHNLAELKRDYEEE